MRTWGRALIAGGFIVVLVLAVVLMLVGFFFLFVTAFTSGCYDDCPVPPLRSGVNEIALSPDGDNALVARRTGDTSEVLLLDVTASSARVLESTSLNVDAVAIIDEHRWAYAGYDHGPFNGSTLVLEGAEGPAHFALPNLVTSMTFGPNGDLFLVEASWYGRSSPVGSARAHGFDVWHLDTATGQHVRVSWEGAYDMHGITWDPTGHVVVSRGFKGPVNHDSDEYRTGLLGVSVDERNTTWEILPESDLLERTPLGFPVDLRGPSVGSGTLRAIGWTGEDEHAFQIEGDEAVSLGPMTVGGYPRALLPDGSGYLAADGDHVLLVAFGRDATVVL